MRTARDRGHNPRYRYNTEASTSRPHLFPGHFNKNKQKLFFFFSQEYDPNTSPNSLPQLRSAHQGNWQRG